MGLQGLCRRVDDATGTHVAVRQPGLAPSHAAGHRPPRTLPTTHRLMHYPSQVLSILRVMPGAPTYKVLQEGDLLLAVNGTPVNTFAAVEAAVLREPRIQLTLLRDGAEVHAARLPD